MGTCFLKNKLGLAVYNPLAYSALGSKSPVSLPTQTSYVSGSAYTSLVTTGGKTQAVVGYHATTVITSVYGPGLAYTSTVSQTGKQTLC